MMTAGQKAAQKRRLNRMAADRIAQARAVTAAAVAATRCPCCGAGLRRNLALAGWWQCEQYGADGFRRDSSRPSCNWQGFTE